MSAQLNFLLGQALEYIHRGNFDSAILLLKQIIKIKSDHAEALRLMAVALAQQGKNESALEFIERSISADKRNGIAYSNKGNIQLNLGMILEAIESHKKAIQLTPNYAEAYSNLGNVYQDLGEINNAIESYLKAIAIEKGNPEFFCNLGNAYWKLDMLAEARCSYENAIALMPNHINSIHNLAHLDLREFKFADGWSHYEARWHANEDSRPTPIKSSKPVWNGLPRNNRLFIWAEQGIGDQILYGSMLRSLERYPQSKIVSVDKKLIPIFERVFPNFKIIDKNSDLSEEAYDEQIPMGSLGKYLRPDTGSFNHHDSAYLMPPKKVDSNESEISKYFHGGINCGISWSSKRAKLGKNKSIHLNELAPILKMKNINFINLQYGDVNNEIMAINSELGSSIQMPEEIDLFDDIDGVLSLIDKCDIVVTTSNTTAHLAGMSGKETLLLLPIGNSRFWYWHDIDGVSLWYPSIKIFKQQSQGDWSAPIQAIKAYLEKRFEI